MATLPPYFGPGTDGQTVKIEAHLLAWPTVGTGRFTAFSEYSASFTGTYKIVTYSGDVSLSITLTDQNPGATSGPATMVVNGKTDTNARYSVSGNALTVTTTALGNPGTFKIYSGDGGTYVEPGGLPLDPTLWIAPE
jgi:hypothetical protein